MRYAQLEVDSGNLLQARSIFERALSVDYSYVPLWHRYAEIEAKAGQYANASAVLTRATKLLPLQRKLWLTRLEFAELRGELAQCREIFQQWKATESPDVWRAWYMFEKRNSAKKQDIVALLEQWTRAVPENVDSWILLASNMDEAAAKNVYQSALDSHALSKDDINRIQELLIGGAAMAGPGRISNLVQDIDIVQLESTASGNDIGLWWASVNQYANLDSSKKVLLLKTAVERCLPKNIPKHSEAKPLEWRMYALLWLRYAITVEQTSDSEESAADIYERALSLWHHHIFTSVTLWKNYALYWLRHGEVQKCRKVFGSALGKTRHNAKANKSILQNYISLEKELLEDNRVRKLYGILCSNWPALSLSWIQFAEFETSLNESQRANFLFETALSLPKPVDDRDAVWKAWADSIADYDLLKSREIWETAIVNCDNKADLYTHYAMFEVGTGLDDDSDVPDHDAIKRARAIFDRGMGILEPDSNQRAELFDMYREFEENYGTDKTSQELTERFTSQPSVEEESTQQQSSNEDSKTNETQLSAVQKLLANAHKWKEAQSS